MLVALAITVMIGVSVTSVILAIATNGHREFQQVDHYESVRLAAHMIMYDARFVRFAETEDGASLVLYASDDPNSYIKYIFASWDGSAEGVPDSENLHRWEVEGGSLLHDEVVARNLVPPDPDPWNPGDTTRFAVTYEDKDRHVEVTLVKPPIRGQEWPTRIQVWALLR